MAVQTINLRQEVTHNDARSMISWMEDQEITRYLNEFINISSELRTAVNRVSTMVLTPLFSRDGSFYMICAEEDEPIGFLKLVHKPTETEMVIVIGDKTRWGHGYGTQAIRHGLNNAFFNLRKPRVIAKIHPDNTRSTLRYWESEGLIRLPRDSTNNYRQYNPNFLYTISDLAHYRCLRMSLDDMKKQASGSLSYLPDTCSPRTTINTMTTIRLTPNYNPEPQITTYLTC